MTLVAAPAHRPTHRTHRTDRTHRPLRSRHIARRAPEPVSCPHCGHAAGFILDLDTFAYRVLEDDRDTDLLDGQDEHTPLTCAHCDTAITTVDALALAHRYEGTARGREEPPLRNHRPHPGHPHDAGPARWRTPRTGHPLPACPQCPRDHGFLADLDGVAYHVLEDDADTDLLAEAANLLCPDCGAVFTHHTDVQTDPTTS